MDFWIRAIVGTVGVVWFALVFRRFAQKELARRNARRAGQQVRTSGADKIERLRMWSGFVGMISPLGFFVMALAPERRGWHLTMLYVIVGVLVLAWGTYLILSLVQGFLLGRDDARKGSSY